MTVNFSQKTKGAGMDRGPHTPRDSVGLPDLSSAYELFVDTALTSGSMPHRELGDLEHGRRSAGEVVVVKNRIVSTPVAQAIQRTDLSARNMGWISRDRMCTHCALFKSPRMIIDGHVWIRTETSG